MTTSKLLGVLFLVASAFFLIQSPGWQFGYLALSGALAFIGLLLLVRRRPRGFSRPKPVYVTSRVPTK